MTLPSAAKKSLLRRAGWSQSNKPIPVDKIVRVEHDDGRIDYFKDGKLDYTAIRGKNGERARVIIQG